MKENNVTLHYEKNTRRTNINYKGRFVIYNLLQLIVINRTICNSFTGADQFMLCIVLK